MESDSEAAESELGEAVSVQGNFTSGYNDDEIYYNFYPYLPNRASFSLM